MKRIAHKQNEMGMYSTRVMEGWGSCFKKEKKKQHLISKSSAQASSQIVCHKITL